MLTSGMAHAWAARWEVASLLLETCAFFLVTVELYGEERLRQLNLRMTRGFAGLRLQGQRTETDGIMTNWLTSIGVFATGCLFYVFRNIGSGRRLKLVVLEVAYFFMGFGGLAILGEIVQLAIRLCLFLLSKRTLKGLFLVLGATLFLGSKVISLVRLLR
jgi:hypothetical protein